MTELERFEVWPEYPDQRLVSAQALPGLRRNVDAAAAAGGLIRCAAFDYGGGAKVDVDALDRPEILLAADVLYAPGADARLLDLLGRLGGLRALWLAHTTRGAATDTLHRVLRRFRGGREPVAAVGRAALYELDLALFNAT